MDNQKTTMKQPSSGVSNEAVFYKLLATPDINLAVIFIGALLKPPWNQRKFNFFRFCVAKYPGLLSLKLIQIYTSKAPRVLSEIRESAMKFLYVIIVVEQVSFNSATVQQLWTRLITCLEEQEISETSLKILSKLVNRIAFKFITDHKAKWHDLRLRVTMENYRLNQKTKKMQLLNELSNGSLRA